MASFMFSLIDAMKSIKYILATFLLLGSICLSGQNLQKYYTSKNLEDGLLYFIKPMKLYKTCQNACYFDQTILPKNDTVSVGMTLTNKETFRVDSIAFLKDSNIISTAGGRKIRLTFDGEQKTKDPMISRMVLECGAPVNILFADTRVLEGVVYGHMVIELPPEEREAEKLIYWLSSNNVKWKEEI